MQLPSSPRILASRLPLVYVACEGPVMVEPERRLQVVIDVTIVDDTYKLNISARPMVPVLDLALIFRRAAEQMESGRLEGLTVRPLTEGPA